MTTNELQAMLIARLVRIAGGSPRQWRIAIGPIRLHDLATHAHCNWSVAPSGSAREIATIERLLDTMRLTHPIVVSG